MEGQQLGSYKIERKLGEGGMGVVWVGVDARLGRRAAVKQLLPEMSGNKEFVERFFNEAKAAASINHPGIVEIYDVGWHVDGSAYFAMKLLQGDSLARRLRDGGPMSPMVAATVTRQVASALAAAHARGIVHRDLKPDNVVLVADEEMSIGERATVLDFGIAKLFGEAGASPKTRTGMVMGTPSYMSPEQCRGAGDVDVRTDVYALGCILFEMLTGRPPFVADGVGEVLGMHQFVEPPPVRSLRPEVPAALERVVMRALAKRPEDRQQTMGELTAELQPFAAARPSMERPVTSAPPDAATLAVPASQVAAAPPPSARPHEATTLSAGRGQLAGAAPTPDAGAAATAGAGNRRVLLGLGAAAVVAAVVIAVLASGGGSGAGKGEPATSAGEVAADAPLAPDAAEAAAVAEPAPAIDAAPPADPDAHIYLEFAAAAERREYVRAVELYGQIAPASPFAAQARRRFGELRKEAVAESRAQAKLLAADRRCDELLLLAVAAGKAFPEAGAAVTAVKCKPPAKPAAAVAPKPAVDAGTVAAKPAVDAGTAPVEPPKPKIARELIDDALWSFRMGSYASALGRAEDALRVTTDAEERSTASATAVMAACAMKDATKARRHAPQVGSPGQRDTVAKLCTAYGITLD